jgi:hypothetical protein
MMLMNFKSGNYEVVLQSFFGSRKRLERDSSCRIRLKSKHFHHQPVSCIIFNEKFVLIGLMAESHKFELEIFIFNRMKKINVEGNLVCIFSFGLTSF